MTFNFVCLRNGSLFLEKELKKAPGEMSVPVQEECKCHFTFKET